MSEPPALPHSARSQTPPPLPKPKSHLVAMILGGGAAIVGLVVLLSLGYVGTMGPETFVVSGDKVKSHHLRTIRELGLLQEGETIQWFYSDGFLDIREGIYFVTETRLVTYCTHYEPHEFSPMLEDIVRVNLDRHTSFWEDSDLEITLIDGEEWYFPISSEKGGDTKFYEYIKARHRPDRVAGNQKLLEGLGSWSESGGDLQEILDDEVGAAIETAGEAAAVVEALKKLSFESAQEERKFFSNCRTLVAFFEQAETQTSWDALGVSGLPELRRLLREGLRQPEKRESDLFYLMEILAWYENVDDVPRIAEIARSGFAPGDHRWSSVFGRYGEESGEWESFIDSLRDPLPDGFVGIAYLDAANELALAGLLKNHPYDSPTGLVKLSAWLSGTNEQEFSYAHSSAVSLPFLSPETRRPLLKLAGEHPDVGVRIERAWALAKLGEEEGVKILADWTLKVNHSVTARRYLEELELSHRIPEAALEEDFVAKAEMVRWLSHPNEFARPPDKIEQFDSRTLYWPPTNDRRKVWLFKYTYLEDNEEPEVGLGMHGSVTFAIFGENTAKFSATEAYGLHCAWELENDEDERAPEETSVESGLKILRQYNKDLKE